jgi:hypothetical protein
MSHLAPKSSPSSGPNTFALKRKDWWRAFSFARYGYSNYRNLSGSYQRFPEEPRAGVRSSLVSTRLRPRTRCVLATPALGSTGASTTPRLFCPRRAPRPAALRASAARSLTKGRAHEASGHGRRRLNQPCGGAAFLTQARTAHASWGAI